MWDQISIIVYTKINFMQIRPTKACINLSNLANNYQKIRSYAHQSEVIAVVKADAYGHGARRIVEKLNTLDHPPVMYAVATVEEVIDLRKSFPGIDILLFEPFHPRYLDQARNSRVVITVASLEQLKVLGELDPGCEIDFHLKIDTGMGRLGIKHYETEKLINTLREIKRSGIKGIYTHFAAADEDRSEYTRMQTGRFNRVIEDLRSAGIDTGTIHAANSGGIFDHRSTHFNAVRAGISLYGYYRDRERSVEIGLKPLMSLTSEIGSVAKFRAGENVSYSLRFTTSEDSWIASVPLGYADGVRRSLQNRIAVLINEKIYRQAGTITMDRMMIDLGNDYHPVGTDVTLLTGYFGSGCDCWNWCEVLDTIPYEITCGISSRVPRIYTEASDGLC